MPHFEARMSSKGQITVPAQVREHFALKEGDLVDFYVDPLARAVRILARNAKLSDLVGMLEKPQSTPALTQQQMDDAVGDHLSEKHERISREWNEWREFQDWKKSQAAE